MIKHIFDQAPTCSQSQSQMPLTKVEYTFFFPLTPLNPCYDYAK